MKPQLTPDLSPQSVATLPVVASCPICGTPLQGKQQVCSAKCRIQKSMKTRAGLRRDRDATARMHLRAAQRSVDETQRFITEALALLKEPSDSQ